MNATLTDSDHKLVIKRNFKWSPEKMWDAWTNPEMMKLWTGPSDKFTCNIEADFVVGGSYRLEMDPPENEYVAYGKYIEIDPPHKLVYTWSWIGGVVEPGETLITLELNKIDVGTELILTHSKLSGAESIKGHSEGWNGSLDRLERLIESSQA